MFQPFRYYESPQAYARGYNPVREGGDFAVTISLKQSPRRLPFEATGLINDWILPGELADLVCNRVRGTNSKGDGAATEFSSGAFLVAWGAAHGEPNDADGVEAVYLCERCR
jgi:hypothetical protein